MHHVQEWSQQSPTLSKLGLYNSHSFYSNYYPGSSWDGMDSFWGAAAFRDKTASLQDVWAGADKEGSPFLRLFQSSDGCGWLRAGMVHWIPCWTAHCWTAFGLYIRHSTVRLKMVQKAKHMTQINFMGHSVATGAGWLDWHSCSITWKCVNSGVAPFIALRGDKACQEHGAMSCVRCVPLHHETNGSACGRSHSLAQGGSLCIQKHGVLYFVPCLWWWVCCHVWCNDGSGQPWWQSQWIRLSQKLDSSYPH